MNSTDISLADSAVRGGDGNGDPAADHLDRQRFKDLLARNVAIPLGFGLVSVMFFVVIVNYLLSQSRWVETANNLINSSNLLLQLVIDHETGVRGFVITGKDEFLEPYEAAKTRVAPAIAEIKQLVAEDELQKHRLDEIYASYLRWRDYAEAAISLKRQGQSLEQMIASGSGKRIMDQIRHQSIAFIAEQQRIKTDRSQRAQKLVVILSGGYFVLSLIFSALIAYWGRKQSLALADTYDTALAHEQEQNETLRLQAWLRYGQSRLSDDIIGQLPKPILCQKILSFLAEYLDVVVGAIYIGVDEVRFNRIATYGFSKEMADANQSFESREGLIGQAAADRRPIFLDSVTPSYFKVNSGLGEGKPAAVAIVPIVTDNVVNAVLELGFLRPITARDIEFIDLINDSIGAALLAASYRRRLQDALKEMQQLNEELQAQQEALGMTNEELEAQSKALEESKIRLEVQQADLEQANAILEEQHEILRGKNETLKYTQQLLEDHTQRLENASRYKTEFLANMSHELRTPLNSSLILSKLLADNATGNLTPEQVRFAESIYSAGNDLLALINDVLDIAKVEAGKLDVIPDQTSLPHMLNMLAQHFRPVAQHKNIDFELIIDSDAPLLLHTDRHRLEQILRNLLSNAIKFTATGNVRLHVGDSENAGFVAFTVSDTGIGIEAQHLGQVFEPFYQVDSTTNRKFGGTGLGLSISRQLAGLLGGTITVTSEPKAGSAFTLTIPANLSVNDRATELPAPVPTQAFLADTDEETLFLHKVEADLSVERRSMVRRARSQRGALRARKILVVDDDVRNIFAITSVLEDHGATVEIGRNGLDALSKLSQCADIDLVLMDIMMPEMDGYEAIQEIRKQPQFAELPIIAVTARTMRDDQERCLQVGANDCVAKPVDMERLIALMRGWLPKIRRA